MGRTINFNLFQDDIDDIIKQIGLSQYNFDDKVSEFKDRVADEGIAEAENVMSGAIGDAKSVFFDKIKGADGEVEGISMTGTRTQDGYSDPVNSLVFWEFGAGIHYNGTVKRNPLSTEFEKKAGIPTDIGSYGQHQGLKDSWRTPHGDMSQGTKAMMPMYKANVKMLSEAEYIAKDVFKL